MDWKKQVILASASPRRQELLRQVGIEPKVEPSQLEEVITSSDPAQVVMELSGQKAADIAEKHRGENGVIIGADTVVAADGVILGKPKDRADAIKMIGMLQGRSHQVFTGVTLIEAVSGRTVTFYEKTDVHVYPMTQEQINSYADTGEPMDKAGAYGIQGRFAAYIRGIEGDYTNVVGLPVGRVCQELMKLSEK